MKSWTTVNIVTCQWFPFFVEQALSRADLHWKENIKLTQIFRLNEINDFIADSSSKNKDIETKISVKNI